MATLGRGTKLSYQGGDGVWHRFADSYLYTEPKRTIGRWCWNNLPWWILWLFTRLYHWYLDYEIRQSIKAVHQLYEPFRMFDMQGPSFNPPMTDHLSSDELIKEWFARVMSSMKSTKTAMREMGIATELTGAAVNRFGEAVDNFVELNYGSKA